MKDVTQPAPRQARTPSSWRARLCLLGVLSAFLVCGAQAQEETAATIPGPALDGDSELPQLLAIEALPEPAHVAAALSDRESRNNALLTLVAVERMLDHATRGRASDAAALEARFLDERAWLDRLTLRFNGSPMRGSELDPSAWFVLRELSEHQLEPGEAVSPMGPGDNSLLRQLFDRSDERLSASVLPEVLQRTELKATALWVSVLETAAVNPPLHQVLSGIYADWFHRWVIADPPEPPDSEDGAAVVAQALDRLRALSVSVMGDGPPDDQLLAQLRFDLLTVMPALDEVRSRDAGYMLELATAIDGLQDGEYLAFTEDLLSVVSELLLNEKALEPPVPAEEVPLAGPGDEEPAENPAETVEVVVETEVEPVEPEPRSVVPGFLFELLPGVSAVFSGSFSEVDPRINASLAAAFDVVQYLHNNPGPQDPARLAAMRENIGDSIAQMVLQIPDMGYYFDQPVRQRIANEIDVCISIAAGSGQPDAAGFSREQFDGCLKSLVEMSRDLVSKEELSGDSFGPFGSEQLRRELMMTPWQRINFALGYLHDRFPTGCELPAQPLPNPLEWSGLATVITWFARQAPVYFQTPENETLLLAMRQQGLDLLNNMAQQVDCISGQGMGIKDPVRRSLANYRLALNDLVAGIHQAELDFRARRLKPGADVALHGDASQATAYRTEGLVIGPCDPQAVCEMTGELEATRALVGLFPDPYLIADQTGLGRVEICYQNVEWVDRRAVPVRPEDPSVANYFGHLSFELVGRYHEKGAVSDVFGSTIVSPDEYHYLFAAATDEVRDDPCPVEWVGSRVVTTLENPGPVQVVPNRLTYLASARKRPSEVIEANWSRGAEWRDWFVTGLGVKPHEYPPNESIYGRVNQHLRNLYQIQQSTIYAALLRPQTSDAEGDAMASLLDLQVELTARKALIRAYLNLFYPDSMMESDDIRGALEGYGSLLDTSTLLRFRESKVAVSSINEAGISRIEAFQADWNRQPETVRRTGSVSISVAHAIIRLNALYFEFFVLPTESRESRNDVMSPF